MINDHVYEWLKSKGFEDRLTEHSETIDTVEHADRVFRGGDRQNSNCSDTGSSMYGGSLQIA